MTAVSRSSFLVPDLAYSFCPGCSHGQIADALGGALQRTGVEKTRAALVSDIGCVGLVDQHFDVNTFHGLHGRAVTYATGLKLARPELRVVAVVGDGGCGIGGTHLIQAARRDTDITVVVFNNFNYGMTGGEHSCTTPTGALTSSTPTGNTEQGLDLCGLVMAAGAGFVARAPAFDGELETTLTAAVNHPGFAMVDVWEICTAYFMPSNNFKRKALLALSETSGMEFGVLRERRREATAPLSRPGISRVDLAPVFEAPLRRPLRLLIAGSAGQKIKTAATTLGRTAIRCGLHATQKDDYPITVKAGHSVAEMIISPSPIRFTGIDEPDIGVVISDDGLRRSQARLAAMPADGLIYLNDSLAAPETAARIRRVDFSMIARSVGKEYLALWAIARMLADQGGVPAQALEDTVRHHTPARYRDKALAAVEQGMSFAREYHDPAERPGAATG